MHINWIEKVRRRLKKKKRYQRKRPEKESVSCSVVSDFETPWTVAHQAPLTMNSSFENTGVGGHSLLQGIFPTQGSKPGLLHYRQSLYRLSHQGSPRSYSKYVRGLRYDSTVPTNQGHRNTGYPNGKNKTKLDLHLTHTDRMENVYVENKPWKHLHNLRDGQ